jgi:hypothetical protein
VGASIVRIADWWADLEGQIANAYRHGEEAKRNRVEESDSAISLRLIREVYGAGMVTH